MKVPILSDLKLQGESPEYLFWVGCAGSFDDRSKKVTKAFVKILNKANISYAILGKEESCTGDPAKRAGNEFLFQMKAISNIEILNSSNAFEFSQLYHFFIQGTCAKSKRYQDDFCKITGLLL